MPGATWRCCAAAGLPVIGLRSSARLVAAKFEGVHAVCLGRPRDAAPAHALEESSGGFVVRHLGSPAGDALEERIPKKGINDLQRSLAAAVQA